MSWADVHCAGGHWPSVQLILLYYLVMTGYLHVPRGGVIASECGPCDLAACEEASSCPGGTARDACDCCSVCARLEGDRCGGKFGLLGKCDQGLTCVVSPPHGAPLSHYESDGICRNNDRRETPSTRKYPGTILKSTFTLTSSIVYMWDSSVSVKCDYAFSLSPSRHTRGIHPMLFQCWASVEDGGPTLKRHWINASCLLGAVLH